jgi:hypothetical protein
MSKIMSLKQVDRTFPDRWVVMEVTGESAGHVPKGRVLFGCQDRGGISDWLKAFRAQHPDLQYLVYFTGPQVDPAFDGVIVL